MSAATFLLVTASVAATMSSIGALARPHAHRLATASTAPRRSPRRRAMHRLVERSLPDAIELIVLAVRAGHLPLHAIDASLPHLPDVLRPAFTEVTVRVERGERFADALSSLTVLLGTALAPLCDSLAAADRYGLPLAPVLDRLAAEARQHRRRQLDITARQLPVRLAVPLVLCTLPSFVLLAVVPLLLAAFSSLQS